jgi:hypothetical protein
MSDEIGESMRAAEAGCVQQPLRSILRLEALLALIGLTIFYYSLHANWFLFAILLLAPDIAMLGYLKGTRVGAWSYNALHTFVGPLVAAGLSITIPLLLPIAIVWAAHIALDRALGYGLKYADAFGHTHLGAIGASQVRQSD